MDFIPGDRYRIDIVGADSKLLVDSWSSHIRADVISANDTLMVDTQNEKLYGPLVGNLENINGDTVVDVENRSIVANLIGDVFNNNNELILDVDSKILHSDVHGNLLDINGNLIVDAETSIIRADYFEGEFHGEFHGKIVTEDILSGSFFGDFTGEFAGEFVGDITGDVFGNVTGDINGSLTGDVNGNLSGNVNGNLYGNVFNTNGDSKILESTPQSTKLLGTNKKVQIGSNQDEISTVSENIIVNLLRNNQLSSCIMYKTHKGDDFVSTVSEKFEPNEVLVSHLTEAYHENKYMYAGAYGFVVDEGSVVDYMPSKFFVSVSDGYKMPSAITSTRLELDGKGILSVPVLQTRGINLAQRDSLPVKAGMIVFNESIKKFQGFTGTEWVDLH